MARTLPRVRRTCTPRGLRGGAAIWTVALLALAAVTGCDKEDVGRCCVVLPGADPAIIPQPETGSDGQPRNVISTNPDIDCDSLACVSYQGSRPFCTKPCIADGSCPEGFTCQTVLEADPGPMSTLRKGDKFCVKLNHMCTAE